MRACVLFIFVLSFQQIVARHKKHHKAHHEVGEKKENVPTFQTCRDAGFECVACTDCFPGGWCVKDPGDEPKCMCNYGWTGARGKYIPNTKNKRWGKNRIRADDCNRPCAYTHQSRSEECIDKTALTTTTETPTTTTTTTTTTASTTKSTKKSTKKPATKSTTTRKTTSATTRSTTTTTTPLPKTTTPTATTQATTTMSRSSPVTPTPVGCDSRCDNTTGVCVNGTCKCCRGWSGPNAEYHEACDTYYADYCDQECPYLGKGIENPDCARNATEIPKCNPLCMENDGKCIEETGRCLCCEGWTGPHAMYGDGVYEGRILADYCNVYCQYTKSRRNQRCIRADYIERLQIAGHIAGRNSTQ